MKTAMRFVPAILISILAWMVNGAASAAQADETTPALQANINTVSLFKNGLGFIRREAALTRNDDFILFRKLPVPVHGTFWVDGDAGIKDLTAYMQETVEEQAATTIPELLEANIGESVEVRIGDKDIQYKVYIRN